MKHFYRLLLLVIIIVLIYATYIRFGNQQSSKKRTYVDEKEYDDALLENCLYGVFLDSILVLNFNFPFYSNVDRLKDLYEGVFAHVLACGPALTVFANGKGPDIEFNVEDGHFSYHCMALAIERFPNYKGYFYGNDDMIINWWTLVNLTRKKIWHGTKVIDWRQDAYGEVLRPHWIWWKTEMGIVACQNYYKKLKSFAANGVSGFDASSALNIYLRNGGGRPRCAKGWSDFFHIPGHYSEQYKFLSHLAYSNKLYLEIAVHNILRSIDDIKNFELVDGLYMPDEGFENYTMEAFWKLYNHQVAFIHPYKFKTNQMYFSDSELKSKVIQFKEKLTDCVIR